MKSGLLWLRAIESIWDYPWLGLGVGSEGTIGQSEETSQTASKRGESPRCIT